jgi:tetratricopeptide (TPR) repeat protein
MLYLANKYSDKSTISYLYALATDAYEKGNYDLAIERLNELLEIDNTNKKAIVLLKFCNVQKLILEKKYNDAKSELFEILKLEPDNSSALDLLKKVNTLIEIGE